MNRRAFTLIEVLVVMAIIAVLVGILLPAIQSARARARDVETLADLAQLNLACDNAKASRDARFIPSMVMIQPTYNLNSPVEVESLMMLRQFFGNRFGTPSPFNPRLIRSGLPDWGVIQGSQCLVFFLGGYCDGQFGTGFSSEANPFTNPNKGRMVNVFFDFPASKLWYPPSSLVPVFVDRHINSGHGNPYFYFSNYGAIGGYVDVNRRINPSGQITYPQGTYTSFNGSGKSFQIATPMVMSPLLDSTGKYFNQNAQQVLSCGRDGKPGPGGLVQRGQSSYSVGQPGWDDQSSFSPSVMGVDP